MKFAYYITDLNLGTVTGTDDKDKAKEFAESDEHFVVDAENGLLLEYDGTTSEIKEE